MRINQLFRRKTINTAGSRIPNDEDDHLDSKKKDVSRADDGVRLISDEPLVPDKPDKSSLNFGEYSTTLANIIEASPPKFTVGIFGGWGTGKTRLMKMILTQLKNKEKIIPIWFDAWKYERDKYLAVIPLLKLIDVELHNIENGKLKTLKNGVEKTFRAFAESISITAGLADYGSVAINLNKFLKSLKGSTEINGERVYYYSHPSDHIQESLKKLDKNFSYKVVVFIDDLDRCMPDRAVEVLESVKSFFDIEGFVFVIGMNYVSIEDLMKAKYGTNSKITGREYLEKIVQLPFYIPYWDDSELEKLVKQIISDEAEVSNLLNEFKDCEKLVVSAIRKNPRDAKRFINSIILTKTVFGRIRGLKIDQLIAVQALRYREEWNKLLEIIKSNDNSRKSFFEEYLILKRVKDIDAFKIKVNKIFPNFFDAYDSILKEDDAIRLFLDSGAAEKLRDIANISDYLIALSSTDKPISTVQNLTIRLSSPKTEIKAGEELEVHALALDNDGMPINKVTIKFEINDNSIAELKLPYEAVYTDQDGIAATSVRGKRAGKTKLNAFGTKLVYDIQIDANRKLVNEDSLDILITS